MMNWYESRKAVTFSNGPQNENIIVFNSFMFYVRKNMAQWRYSVVVFGVIGTHLNIRVYLSHYLGLFICLFSYIQHYLSAFQLMDIEPFWAVQFFHRKNCFADHCMRACLDRFTFLNIWLQYRDAEIYSITPASTDKFKKDLSKKQKKNSYIQRSIHLGSRYTYQRSAWTPFSVSVSFRIRVLPYPSMSVKNLKLERLNLLFWGSEENEHSKQDCHSSIIENQKIRDTTYQTVKNVICAD